MKQSEPDTYEKKCVACDSTNIKSLEMTWSDGWLLCACLECGDVFSTNDKRCVDCGINQPINFGKWDGGKYCEKCFHSAERSADSMRCEVKANRMQNLNDDGSMTANITNGLVDHGRRDP